MKHRFLGVMLTLAVGLSLALVVACGDDDSSNKATSTNTGSSSSGNQSLAQYFQHVKDISNKLDEQGHSLSDQYPNSSTDPDQARSYYSAALPLFGYTISQLKDLDPPSDVKSQHEAFLSALEDFGSALQGLSDDLKQINSESDLQDYLNNKTDNVSVKSDAVTVACLGLQTVADKNNVSVDLQCNGSSSSASPTSGSQTEEGYFMQLETIFHDTDADLNQLRGELDGSVNSNSTVVEQVQAINTFLDASNETIQNALDELDKQDPPPAARSKQAAFVSAINRSLELIIALKSDLKGVQTQAELDSVVSNFDAQFSSATSDADAACSDLQQLAADANVTIDLKCGQ
jgi:hypothetical protein